MDDDSLVYTNLLVYSPEPSPDGLIRMEEAVIPIECHYKRLGDFFFFFLFYLVFFLMN